MVDIAINPQSFVLNRRVRIKFLNERSKDLIVPSRTPQAKLSK